jgi:threonine/homoserine/homoserine lactone efflux protein
MTLSIIISMSLFAFAASISPGPVNLVSLSTSARSGFKSGLVFISGATFGFVVLFLCIGFCLQYVLVQLVWITHVLKWLGVIFLLYLSYQLFIDNGGLNTDEKKSNPGFMTGVFMQWLNPKAWLASLSGIAAYTHAAQVNELIIFAGLYLPICWLSLSCWVWLGVKLGLHFKRPNKIRLLNKTLAVLLAFSCLLIMLK